MLKGRVGAHVIALGDVSVTGKEIAVTHTRYTFAKADWDRGFAGPSLAGFVSPIPERDSAVLTRTAGLLCAATLAGSRPPG